MKKSAITATIAAGFAAALFGLAAPANAGIDHHSWLNDVQQQAVVGSATSTVGTYVDEVAYAYPFMNTGPMFDLERVEVL